MIDFFTQSAGLGEQDRMGLLCIYEFSRESLSYNPTRLGRKGSLSMV